MENRFLLSREVCKIFGISYTTFLNWVKDGTIRTVVIKKHHYIPVEEIDRLKGINLEVKQ